MSLLLAMPEGITEQTEQAFAAIQTWAGKHEGLGRWNDIPFSAGLFYPDSGTWTVTSGNIKVFKYTLAGNMMTVVFHFSQSVAATVNVLYFKIPAPYRPVGPSTNMPTLHGVGMSTTNACGVWRDADDYTPGVVGVLHSIVSPPRSITLAVMKLATGAIDNVGYAGCFGEITFEVQPEG